MFTNGSTAIECGGGEKAAAAAVVVAAAAGAEDVTGGASRACFELQNLSATEYASATASRATTARSAGFDHEDARTGCLLAGVAPDAVLAGGGIPVGALVSSDSSRLTRSTNAGVACPPGNRVHCSSRNRSGMASSDCDVSSITTGSRKGCLAAIRCERSTASFHSRRKYPSTRACALAEMTGMNSAHALIWSRIDSSQASPPRSSLWSSQTSMPAARSASQMCRAASASCDA